MSQQHFISPPAIAPVAADLPRPRWSVMIPVRNRLEYLEQCLRSVLNQAPGPDEMQIEVVDNSTHEIDVRVFVRQIAGDRIGYYRQPRELGMAENWNSCIDRTRGELVHILHDDDWVGPNFYAEMGDLARRQPACGVLVSRAFIVDDRGSILSLSARAERYEENCTTDPGPILYNNLFRTPAVVMRRTSVERSGGFRNFGHVSDWDMWVRLVSAEGCCFTNQPLAYYRLSATNLTEFHERSGAAAADSIGLGVVLQTEIPEFDAAEFRRVIVVGCEDRLLSYLQERDFGAVRTYAALWWRTSPLQRKVVGPLRIGFRLGRTTLAAARRRI